MMPREPTNLLKQDLKSPQTLKIHQNRHCTRCGLKKAAFMTLQVLSGSKYLPSRSLRTQVLHSVESYTWLVLQEYMVLPRGHQRPGTCRLNIRDTTLRHRHRRSRPSSSSLKPVRYWNPPLWPSYQLTPSCHRLRSSTSFEIKLLSSIRVPLGRLLSAHHPRPLGLCRSRPV